MKKVICPKCNKEAPWVENKVKYGRNFGKSFMCYFCKSCDTYVGCHNNTREPLGTMADRDTMKWRQQAHQSLDIFWKNRGQNRKDVYKKLKDYFGEEIHIGSAGIKRCQDIINAIPIIFLK